jgi:two-component system cell cycle response regulator DivK
MESKKVLIAEDSSVIQNLTKKILQIQNYQIFSAKNGLEVLSMLENDYYDIILMDINMPKMDGMECAAKNKSTR